MGKCPFEVFQFISDHESSVKINKFNKLMILLKEHLS